MKRTFVLVGIITTLAFCGIVSAETVSASGVEITLKGKPHPQTGRPRMPAYNPFYAELTELGVLLSEDDIIRFVIEETSKIFPDSVNINIENIHLEFDDEIAEIRANKATELYENLLINNPNDYDMQIINYYYASASSLPVSEVSEYTSSIEAIVENSNITDESKTKVNSVISLTESSIVLWQGL